MPFIDVRISKPVHAEQKELFKTLLGETIDVIPNKSESVLMIDIADDRELYFRGERLENGAYAKVNLHMEAPQEAKAALIERMFEIFSESFGFKKEDVFISVAEFPNWGANGMWL